MWRSDPNDPLPGSPSRPDPDRPRRGIAPAETEGWESPSSRLPAQPTASHKGLWTGLLIGVVALAIIGGCFLGYRWISSLGSAAPPPAAARCASNANGLQAELSLEQSRNAAIMAGIANRRDLAPRATSIAIATSLQESGLRNLDYGDRDSLGLFQQRPSMGWGTVEQVTDPYYATNKFFDVMVTVKNWETSDIGDVAQSVQRSGFPDAYDKHVERAKTLATALSGQSHAIWSCVATQISPPDPQTLLTNLTQAFGPTVSAQLTEATDEQAASISLTATSEDVAWSAGAFAQSWASLTGVSTVRVGDSSWEMSTSVLSGWVESVDQATGPTAPTTVTISF